MKSATHRRVRHPTRVAAGLALLLHTLAVLWIWTAWQSGLRSGWLVWMDLPASLLYLEARGNALLAASLLLGGLWWATVGALLSAGIGVLARAR